MKNPKAPAASAASSVISMSEIHKLSLADSSTRFAACATVNQRAFAEMGKLRRHIEVHLTKGQTVYGVLRKAGVRDGTISNAKYGADVFHLVESEHLTEAEYDGFTFADCLAICRVMSDKSKARLDGKAVADVIRSAPETFDAELESIFTNGCTVAEATAQAETAVKEAASKAIAAEEKRIADGVAAGIAAGPQAGASTPSSTPSTGQDGQEGTAPTATNTPKAGGKSNIIPMPGNAPAVAKTTVTEALDTVTALETGCADLTEHEIGEVHAALTALVAKLAQRLPAPAKKAARV